MLPTKFQVNWPIGSEEVAKYRFSRWRPSWIPIGMIWQFLILQVILMLPTQFESTGLMVQKKKKKDFQDSPRRPSWISDRTDFSFFFFYYLQVTPVLLTKFHVKGHFSSGEKKTFKIAAILDFHSKRF